MTDPVADSPRVSRHCPALVFVNTAAGGRRGNPYALRIQNLFRELRFPAEFLVTKNSEELQPNVRQAIANKCKLLLAMGGDGTFQGLVNAAFGEDVVLGILPTGGGNDFAVALGLPGDPVIAARAVAGGQPRWVDLIRVNTADGRSRLYVGGGGIGLDAEAARYASGVFRRLPGRSRYIASAVRVLAGALNAPTYGAGLRFAPEAQIDDGLLDVVLIENLSMFGVLALLPRLILSGELRTSRVRRWRAQRVRLTTRRPTMFHGDGEIIGPTPVEIEVVPRGLRVLAPAPT